MERDNLLFLLSLDFDSVHVELLYLICRGGHILKNILCSHGQNSFLVFQLILNIEEFALVLTCVAVVESVMPNKRRVLIKFEFSDRLHVFLLLKIDLHELVFRYDVFFAARVPLRHIERLGEADGQALHLTFFYLAFAFRGVQAFL